MSLHSVGKCPVCRASTGLFVDSRGKRAIWQCLNKHRFLNDKGNRGTRISDAPSTMIRFKR